MKCRFLSTWKNHLVELVRQHQSVASAEDTGPPRKRSKREIEPRPRKRPREGLAPLSTKKTRVERLKTSIVAAVETAAAGASHSSSSSSSMDTRSPAQHRVAGFRPFRIPVPPRHIGPPPLPAPRGGAPPATLAQQSGRGKQPSTRFDKLDKDLETLTVLTVPPF